MIVLPVQGFVLPVGWMYLLEKNEMKMLKKIRQFLRADTSISNPELLEIEPTLGCNLRCIMCHVPTMKEKNQFLDLDRLEKATEGLTDIHVMLGSEFEPTIHPQFERLLRLSVKRRWKLDFLTNATNLHRYDEALLRDVDFHVFNVSFDGSTKESFEFSRRGARYGQVYENALKYAEIARSNGAYTAINATLMRSNVAETPQLVRMWNDNGFDLVRFNLAQARAVDEATLNQTLYPIIDEAISALDATAQMLASENMRIGVRNGYYSSSVFKRPAGVEVVESTIRSENPDFRHVPGVRQDIQNGDWPGMKWPCRSPFVYARIRWDGMVDMCNNRAFDVGSIYEDTFADIWNGERASQQRIAIMGDTSICAGCDYYRFCLNARQLDITAPESHFAGGVFVSAEAKAWLNKKQP